MFYIHDHTFFHSQFGLVVVNDPSDLSTQDHLHDVMMSHVMNRSRSHCPDPLLSQADLQQYLSIASGIEVKLSDSASELLKAFYVASRKVRASSTHGTDVPIGALNSMYVCRVKKS